MMKKYLLLFSFLGLPLATHSQELFSFDFSEDHTGFFVVYDEGNTPSTEMKAIGFDIGKPWVPIRESADSKNLFYGSTSSYTPAGQADDWLVTKGISIPSADCVLEWKSQSYDPKKRDGLKIFISTTGQKQADFPGTPVWEVEEEEAGSANPDVIEGEWIKHSISLNAYAGQTIYIAFVNQSNDKSMIFLDDIWVGHREDYSFSLDVGEYVTTPDVEISGQLRVTNDVTIDAYTAHYSYGEQEYSKSYTGLGLHNGGTHSFVFDEKIPLETGNTVEYRVWLEVNGKKSQEQTNKATRVSRIPKRNVVIEEGTGTWCGYCVLGIWAMDYLRETYGEDGFIGIAVHNNDPMVVPAYDRALGFSALPEGLVNRKIHCNPVTKERKLQSTGSEPETFVDHYLKICEEGAIGDIAVTGSYNADSTGIEAQATVNSIIPVKDADYRVAFVLIENGVKGYKQSNYCSGSSVPVGGFEDLPESCDIAFNEVARGIWPNFEGDENSLPSTLSVDEPIEYSYPIELPKTIKNIRHLELIGLLLNGKTGEIINAGKYPMTPDAQSGIRQVENALLKTSVAGAQLSVLLEGAGTVHAELFDMSGRKIGSAKGESNRTFSIPVSGYQGVVILRVHGQNSVVIRKVSL